MTNQSDAFLSYTRLDDEFFGGAITSFRKFLELGVKVVTGRKNFTIFQDIDGIEFGQRWQTQLDQAINNTRFLIPIVTPLFFESDPCRDELRKFIDHEKALGRGDLILPIYYVTAPVLEKQELLKDDPLASEISARQRYDWRATADLPINDPQTRIAVKNLSEKIGVALERTGPARGPGRASIAARDTAPMSDVSRTEDDRDAAFHKASEAVSKQVPIAQKDQDFRTVLWVDDNPDNNNYERQAMLRYKIKFELAQSTGEALARLRKEKFDAIISDMGRPPDMRAGYTLLDALRGSGDLTPYFIYAGSDSEQHRREALARGAQGSTNRSDKLIKGLLDSIQPA